MTDTGEVRTVSSTGGAKGVKPARFEMIPADSLWELAEHFGKGTAKYPSADGLDNWRRGYEWSKSFGALLRHAFKALGGEDIDPESGISHIAHVAASAMIVMDAANQGTLEMDRPPKKS